MIIKNKHILLFIFIILWYILTRSCEYRDGFNVGIENKPKWKIRDGYNCAFANTEKYGDLTNSPNILNECNNYRLLQWPRMQECNETFYTNDEGINKMCHFENFNCSKTNDNLPESLPNYYNTIDCRKITLRPNDGGDALLNRLKKAYNQKGSNGVFISMIFNVNAIYDGLIYLDGSGSIINNNVYIDFWGAACTFGFIWDTDWLDKNLVSCLFPFDSYTTPIKSCNRYCLPNSTGSGEECFNSDIDACKLANTSNDGKTPDRCSQGLLGYINLRKKYPNLYKEPYPTNCNQNIKYVTDNEPHIEPLTNSSYCFNYIVDDLENKEIKQTYNEAVFLKDIDDGIEINKGLAMLKDLNKPLPVALIFYTHYEDISLGCSTTEYEYMFKAFNNYFTPDTIVIIYYHSEIYPTIFKFQGYTTLNDMPKPTYG